MDSSNPATWYGNKLWFFESLQGLARLDATLIEGDRKLLVSANRDEHFADANTDQITLSGLWLMGTYEWLRTFKVRLGQAKHPQLPHFNALCARFGSVRVPLAKFEPQRNKNNKKLEGYSIARPGMSRKGSGWLVDEGVFVSRLELANELIIALTEYNHFSRQILPHPKGPTDLPEFLCDEPWPVQT
jgi:hypothetical protein